MFKPVHIQIKYDLKYKYILQQYINDTQQLECVVMNSMFGHIEQTLFFISHSLINVWADQTKYGVYLVWQSVKFGNCWCAFEGIVRLPGQSLQRSAGVKAGMPVCSHWKVIQVILEERFTLQAVCHLCYETDKNKSANNDLHSSRTSLFQLFTGQKLMTQ